jgi:molybdate transport system substrate-binding protein
MIRTLLALALLATPVAAAQSAAPATGQDSLLNVWRYDLPQESLRCINTPEVKSVRLIVSIARGDDGTLTMTQHGAQVSFIKREGDASAGVSVLEPWCTLPLRPAGSGEAVGVEPNSLCGNEGMGARFVERSFLPGETGPRVHERGTLFLWTNVCEYEADMQLVRDTTAEEMKAAFQQMAEEFERKQKEEAAKPKPPPPPREQLTIYADAALRDVFLALVADFEKENYDIHPNFEFGTSAELRQKLRAGVPGQALVLESRHGSGLWDFSMDMAANELVAVVPKAKGKRFKKLPDLAKARRVLVAGPEHMLGRHTAAALERAPRVFGKKVAPLSKRLKPAAVAPSEMIKQVLRRKADAAIVYRSDAVKAGKRVAIVELPRELKPFVLYTGARLESSNSSPLVGPWIGMNAYPWAQKAFEKFGFRWKVRELEDAVWSDTVTDPEPEAKPEEAQEEAQVEEEQAEEQQQDEAAANE